MISWFWEFLVLESRNSFSHVFLVVKSCQFFLLWFHYVIIQFAKNDFLLTVCQVMHWLLSRTAYRIRTIFYRVGIMTTLVFGFTFNAIITAVLFECRILYILYVICYFLVSRGIFGMCIYYEQASLVFFTCSQWSWKCKLIWWISPTAFSAS